ncbi:MAG: hypothetical protein WBW33_10210 [Bryobacteraceae bacterium]
MLKRTTLVSVAGCVALWAGSGSAVPSLLAQTSPAWTLPQGTAVKDSGPRTYRFKVDYNTANTKGEVIRRQRLTGEYTRGLPGGEVMWKNVGQADADGATGPFPAAQKRDFMEGFRYKNDPANTLAPEFFKGFPVTAVFERNLVWDTGMMEMFGQDFEHLKLNEPYSPASDQDVNMPGVGTFRNHKVVLEWIGRSQRNGQDCALITYQAFFNPVSIANGGMSLIGRSDYWGEIWVALATKQIEYGTIYENVQGELKLAGRDAIQNISVFRIGTLEPVNR